MLKPPLAPVFLNKVVTASSTFLANCFLAKRARAKRFIFLIVWVCTESGFGHPIVLVVILHLLLFLTAALVSVHFRLLPLPGGPGRPIRQQLSLVGVACQSLFEEGLFSAVSCTDFRSSE